MHLFPMSTRRSRFQPASGPSARAELSPLRGRATQHAVARLGVFARRAEDRINLQAFALDRFNPAPITASEGRWSPNLIDRLQSPLTRYHD